MYGHTTFTSGHFQRKRASHFQATLQIGVNPVVHNVVRKTIPRIPWIPWKRPEIPFRLPLVARRHLEHGWWFDLEKILRGLPFTLDSNWWQLPLSPVFLRLPFFCIMSQWSLLWYREQVYSHSHMSALLSSSTMIILGWAMNDYIHHTEWEIDRLLWYEPCEHQWCLLPNMIMLTVLFVPGWSVLYCS